MKKITTTQMVIGAYMYFTKDDNTKVASTPVTVAGDENEMAKESLK